jgi:hypothetical protein
MGGTTFNPKALLPFKSKDPFKAESHMPLVDAKTKVQPAAPSIKHTPDAPKRLRVNAKGTGTNTGGT